MLNEELQASVFFYDRALGSNDMDLAEVLHMRFYGDSEPDIVKLNILVSYVRRTMSVLDHIDLETLVSLKTFRWLPLVEENEESVYFLPKMTRPSLPSK